MYSTFQINARTMSQVGFSVNQLQNGQIGKSIHKRSFSNIRSVSHQRPSVSPQTTKNTLDKLCSMRVGRRTFSGNATTCKALSITSYVGNETSTTRITSSSVKARSSLHLVSNMELQHTPLILQTLATSARSKLSHSKAIPEAAVSQSTKEHISHLSAQSPSRKTSPKLQNVRPLPNRFQTLVTSAGLPSIAPTPTMQYTTTFSGKSCIPTALPSRQFYPRNFSTMSSNLAGKQIPSLPTVGQSTVTSAKSSFATVKPFSNLLITSSNSSSDTVQPFSKVTTSASNSVFANVRPFSKTSSAKLSSTRVKPPPNLPITPGDSSFTSFRASSSAPPRRHFSSSSSPGLKIISKEEAVTHIKPNSVVFVEGVVGTPKVLMNAMYDHVKGNSIQGVTILDVFSLYPYDNMTLEDDCVRRLSFFVSPYTRKFVNKGRAEYVPLMLNDLPMVFDNGYYTPDVALISVSPPDAQGWVSLGTNVTELHSVVNASKTVIAQVNDKFPRSLGDALLHVDQIDYGVEVSYELFSPASEPVTEVDKAIANLICDNLIEDEATLQIGLGKIPESILSNIKHHKNLGVHTELLTSGVMGLIQGGVINNSKKTIDRDIITATLLLGDRALYDFVHNNEQVHMKPCTYSNNPAIIRQNHRMTAINTCLEIDITGQVVSDSLGTSIYSGFGGQVDFMRGAMTGLDGRGKAILALPSTDEKSGTSKIVSTIKPGAGVVCSRAHVNYIVTEYGAVDLCAKSTVQRAYHLIRLAHPDHRETLEKEAFEVLGVMPRP